MRLSILSLTILATAASSSYVVQDDYSTDSFADMFDFYTVSCSSRHSSKSKPMTDFL